MYKKIRIRRNVTNKQTIFIAAEKSPNIKGWDANAIDRLRFFSSISLRFSIIFDGDTETFILVFSFPRLLLYSSFLLLFVLIEKRNRSIEAEMDKYVRAKQ